MTETSLDILQHCTTTTYNLYSPNDQENLILYLDSGACHDTGLAKAVINVTFKSCPNGFSRSGDQCTCENRLLKYKAECIIDDHIYIIRRKGLNFWVNYSNKRLILYKKCPIEYCKTEEVNITLDQPDVQCNTNRSGVLCGACALNHSLLFGTSKCEICSDNYLSLLVTFAVAGIALVVFLSFLRLTVATGTINSIILYANIVQTN